MGNYQHIMFEMWFDPKFQLNQVQSIFKKALSTLIKFYRILSSLLYRSDEQVYKHQFSQRQKKMATDPAQNLNGKKS